MYYVLLLLEPVIIVDPLPCPEEREKFHKKVGLPLEPVFDASCIFLPKQCNDEKCWCVKEKNGKVKYGGLEIPLGEDKYDCSSKCWRSLTKYLNDH